MSHFFQFIQISYHSLFVHKFRSFLSILGIVCGVMAVMSMISTGEGAKQEVLSRIEKMGLKNIYIKKVPLSAELQQNIKEIHSYGLTSYDVQRLQRLSPAITRVGATQKVRLTPIGLRTRITPNIIQCTDNYFELLDLKTAAGRFIRSQDLKNNNLVCVLGSSVAKRLGNKGRVGSYMRMNNLVYKIVGILTPYNIDTTQTVKISSENFNDIIFLPLNISGNSTTSHVPDKNNSSLSQIIVEVADREDIRAVAKLIHRTLNITHNNVLDYNVVVPLELMSQSLATQRIFNLVLGVTAGISLLVGGIGIMNIMLATVTERKREIGIRRAVGATQKDIAYQFFTESILLTGAGGLIGLVAGFFCINIIEIMAGWPIQITFLTMVIPFILACATGVFFGLYPALQAAKVDPIQALRTV